MGVAVSTSDLHACNAVLIRLAAHIEVNNWREFNSQVSHTVGPTAVKKEGEGKNDYTFDFPTPICLFTVQLILGNGQ